MWSSHEEAELGSERLVGLGLARLGQCGIREASFMGHVGLTLCRRCQAGLWTAGDSGLQSVFLCHQFSYSLIQVFMGCLLPGKRWVCMS